MRTFLSPVNTCLVLLPFREVVRSTESREKGTGACRRNVENVEHGGQTKKQLRWCGRARRITRPLTHDCVCLVSDVETSTERGWERSRSGRGRKMDGKIQRAELTQKVQRKSITDLGHTVADFRHPAGLKRITMPLRWMKPRSKCFLSSRKDTFIYCCCSFCSSLTKV